MLKSPTSVVGMVRGEAKVSPPQSSHRCGPQRKDCHVSRHFPYDSRRRTGTGWHV
jgi:hypothetical protein